MPSIMAYTSLYLSHALKFMSLANRSHMPIFAKQLLYYVRNRHAVFCLRTFLRVSEQIVCLFHIINRVVFVTETQCVFCNIGSDIEHFQIRLRHHLFCSFRSLLVSGTPCVRCSTAPQLRNLVRFKYRI